MNDPIRILGIAGSLRKASFNRGVLRAATELAPEGVSIEIFELDGIPGFNQDQEQNPPDIVAEFKRKIREADAIFIILAQVGDATGQRRGVTDFHDRLNRRS